MNKTININLAGVFFHIDEDAFLVLKNYLDAIKTSFTDSQGRDEIIHDIEARIAELFSEKMISDRQVISLKEVEEVISIMGQPEDYMVDNDIFEDEEPKKRHTKDSANKKLYRDTDSSYIAGVCSGLSHYLHIDSIWIRIFFILFTFMTSGAFILVYIVFWMIVPEAQTTAEKLEMRGEPINISNIERKVKEGFDTVADKVKGVDYKKYGNKVNSGAHHFFQTLGNFILTILKICVKFVGIVILLISGTSLIALLFSLLSIGTFGVFDAPWMDYVEMANVGAPLWLVSIFIFFVVAVPFFFLFILGLKILVGNLKSIGTPVKLVLLGIWLISVFVLSFLGIRQATERAFEGEYATTEELPVTATDTLTIKMKGNNFYGNKIGRDNGFEIKTDENGNKILYSQDIRLNIRSTKDSLVSLEIIKSAEGQGYQQARERAEEVSYSTNLQNDILYLDAYFTTPSENLYRDQQVKINIYLPEGITLIQDKSISSYLFYKSITNDKQINKYVKILSDGSECMDCPMEVNPEEEWYSEDDIEKEADSLDGLNIEINEEGIKVNHQKVEGIRINSNGIEIKK